VGEDSCGGHRCGEEHFGDVDDGMTVVPAIPARPSEVTSTWLSSVLRVVDPFVSVDEVTVKSVGTGQTGATYRIRATYASGGDQLPRTFIVKLPSQDPEVRQRVALGYRSEYAFYTEVAATVRVPTPHCYHVDIANGGMDFVMVLADLAPAVQGDQIEGCTAVEAALAVEALAGLHGPRWCDPAWLQFDGTVMPQPDADAAKGMGEVTQMAVNVTLERLGSRMTEADRVTLKDSAALVARWLLVEPGRFCLLHGDYRLDNLLFDPERTEITVVDWQTLAVGLPARDLSYFVGTSLLPARRAAIEGDLVGSYHDALMTYGVADYPAEECWRDYLLGMLQIPLITTLGFAFSAATERGDDMALVMLERGCRAIRELRTLEEVTRRA
jgi:aminoglycoside phosphotransferase (APT) family kinase protein